MAARADAKALDAARHDGDHIGRMAVQLIALPREGGAQHQGVAKARMPEEAGLVAVNLVQDVVLPGTLRG